MGYFAKENNSLSAGSLKSQGIPNKKYDVYKVPNVQ